MLFALFAFVAAVAARPSDTGGQQNLVGAAILAVAALVSLGVGIWDSGRCSHYYLDDPPDDDAAS